MEDEKTEEDTRLEETTVRFKEETVEAMDRLIAEGWFEDESDFVTYAIQTKDIDDIESFSADPTLDQRIREINQVKTYVEDDLLGGFFLDTSYVMQLGNRLAKDIGADEYQGRFEKYMQEFAQAVGNPGMTENDAGELVGRTLDLTTDFYNLSDTADAGYEAIIVKYEEEYFDEGTDEEIVELLADQ